jgi:cell division protein FtsW (lipid II flippase)
MSNPTKALRRVGPVVLPVVAAAVLVCGRIVPALREQQGIVWAVAAVLLLLAVVVATAGRRRGRGGR